MQLTLTNVALISNMPARGSRPATLTFAVTVTIRDTVLREMTTTMLVETTVGLEAVMDLTKQQLLNFADRLKDVVNKGDLGHEPKILLNENN